MASLSPVYYLVGWTHDWRGVMRLDKKLGNTIIKDKL
jgi:hypothetical protein